MSAFETGVGSSDQAKHGGLYAFFLTHAWARHALATDAAGGRVEPSSEAATAFCLLGGFLRVYGRDFRAYYHFLMAVQQATGMPATAFNDHPAHSKQDILTLLEKLGW
jgi:hypothetical protein